ncbi:ATP-binding cassette domain-containing protein [Actinomyces sp.]|uniref:ATP-binding cassette domain-containing protein n=1 Tax=Actinomyces sp. TaxID=29317 RepID=UPI0026DD08AE|nr:ABC transporter ATP-binding protein [Actinomyces sp.]MDO4899897.1 ABC transporter ATP-binding protein [Actinomyces sp.]
MPWVGFNAASTPEEGRHLTTREPRQDGRAEAIQVRALGKSYGWHAVLNGVTLDARYGAITCLLGPNGAGKSTLMRILMGHEAISRGSARIALPGDGTLADRAVGYVPDSSLVYPLLTVREHLRLVEAVYDLGRFSRTQEERFLKALGLDEHADVLASKLSKGLKKRLMLACAVRQGARVLILDEPLRRPRPGRPGDAHVPGRAVARPGALRAGVDASTGHRRTGGR